MRRALIGSRRALRRILQRITTSSAKSGSGGTPSIGLKLGSGGVARSAKRPRFAITASTVFCTSSHCLSTSSHPGSLIVSSSGFVGSSHPIRRPGSNASFLDSHTWPAQQLDAKTTRSEEHTSELQSQSNLVCRLLLEK